MALALASVVLISSLEIRELRRPLKRALRWFLSRPSWRPLTRWRDIRLFCYADAAGLKLFNDLLNRLFTEILDLHQICFRGRSKVSESDETAFFESVCNASSERKLFN